MLKEIESLVFFDTQGARQVPSNQQTAFGEHRFMVANDGIEHFAYSIYGHIPDGMIFFEIISLLCMHIIRMDIQVSWSGKR